MKHEISLTWFLTILKKALLTTWWPKYATYRKFHKTQNYGLKISYWRLCVHFFNFSQGRHQSDKKTWQKRSQKCTKVACTFSCTVRAGGQVSWPKQFKTAWDTKLHICWKFGEVRTSFGRAMDTWKKVLLLSKADRQTNRCISILL